MHAVLLAAFLCTSMRTDAPPAYPATAYTLHSADFDGDGHLDLISGGTPGAAVLYGRGNGTFEEPITLVEAFGYAHVADTNGDGRPDVIVAPDRWNGVESLAIVENRGARTWSAPRTLALPRDTFIGAGDFTNDGRADLLTYDGDTFSPVLRLLVANADGSYTALERRAFMQAGGKDSLIDVDGDGNLDFLSIIDQRYGLMRGIGNGLFTQRDPIGAEERFTRATALADFTGDGHADLVLAQDTFPSGQIVLFEGPVASGRTSGKTFSLRPQEYVSRAVAGDFTGDAINDLALITTSLLVVYRNDGRGKFARHSELPIAIDRGDLVAGDFNEDGALDLAAGTPAAAIFLNDGAGTFRGSRILPSGDPQGRYRQILAADFNGDGIDEIIEIVAGRVSAGWLTNGQYVFERVPATFDQYGYVGANRISTGELDDVPGEELVLVAQDKLLQFTWRNGRVQLAASQTVKDVVETAIVGRRLIFVQYDGTNNAGLTELKGQTPIQLLAANADGDALEDLIVLHAGRSINTPVDLGPRRYRDGEVLLIRGRAGGTFAAAERIFSGFGMRDAAVGDFDAGGRDDVAVSTDDGGIFQLLNDGSGTFTSRKIDATNFAELAARDVNGDGITDLAASASRVMLFQGSAHAGLTRAGSWMGGDGIAILQLRHDAPPAIVTSHWWTGELLSIEFECAPRRRVMRH